MRSATCRRSAAAVRPSKLALSLARCLPSAWVVSRDLLDAFKFAWWRPNLLKGAPNLLFYVPVHQYWYVRHEQLYDFHQPIIHHTTAAAAIYVDMHDTLFTKRVHPHLSTSVLREQ